MAGGPTLLSPGMGCRNRPPIATAQRSQQIQRMGFLVISLCATAYAISRIGLGYTVGGSSLHPAIPPDGQRPYPTLAVVPFVWHIGVLPPCLCARVSGVDRAVACHADGTTGLPGAWDRACPVPGRVVMVPAYGAVRQLGRGTGSPGEGHSPSMRTPGRCDRPTAARVHGLRGHW